MRINAMRKLYYIAKALGPERCRSELLPFLSGNVGPRRCGWQAVSASVS